MFYLNVSILVIPNEESTIFNRSSSASCGLSVPPSPTHNSSPDCHHELPSPKFSLSGFCVSSFTDPPDPHLHPPHLLCTCPVHCVVLDQLHSGTFLLHTHVFSLTGSTSPPAPCSHYSSQCCLHHRTHEGPQSRVLMSWRPRFKSICPSYSSPVPCCLLHSLSMCSVCAVPQYVSWCPVVCFFHIHTDMIQLLLTFSALPHLHVEPHFSSSFSRCGSSAPSPCGCCSSAP